MTRKAALSKNNAKLRYRQKQDFKISRKASLALWLASSSELGFISFPAEGGPSCKACREALGRKPRLFQLSARRPLFRRGGPACFTIWQGPPRKEQGEREARGVPFAGCSRVLLGCPSEPAKTTTECVCVCICLGNCSVQSAALGDLCEELKARCGAEWLGVAEGRGARGYYLALPGGGLAKGRICGKQRLSNFLKKERNRDLKV